MDPKAHQRHLQDCLVKSAYWMSCINCEYWGNNSVERLDDKEKICYKFKMLPPPDVLVHGCEHWSIIVPF